MRRRSESGTRGRALRAGQSLTEFALVLPLLIVIFVAVVDLARVYTTMLSVESAAREAADWGAFQSSNWLGDPADPTSNRSKTVEGMIERACAAASDTPDYVASGSGCSNPSVSYELVPDEASCTDSEREPPCRVKVTLTHTFHLLVPLSITIRDVEIGFPSELLIERDSVFAISDLEIPQPSSTP